MADTPINPLASESSAYGASMSFHSPLTLLQAQALADEIAKNAANQNGEMQIGYPCFDSHRR
jgi:hypothetical protein